MRRLILVLFLVALPCWAQLEGFGKDELIKYTAKNPFERFPDGRPKIPEKYIEMLKGASSEMLWGPVRGRVSSISGLAIGRSFTPRRSSSDALSPPCSCLWPDLDEVIEADAKAKGLGRNDNQRDRHAATRRRARRRHVWQGRGWYVCGRQPAAAIHGASGNGFVIDGGVRDLDGIYPQGFPVYVRGFHVSAIKDVMLMGINVPIRIGRTTVMPGDLVVGDREGLTFYPAARGARGRRARQDYRAARHLDQRQACHRQMEG
ncbi:MAG: RraA family protein [Bryobacterales bacterium]